jgi:hypothetical protein
MEDVTMAEHGSVEYSTTAGNDYDAHEKIYLFFLNLVKWNVIIIVIILVLMAYFLV